MVSRDHKLSLRKQCELLQLSRSRLYYQPVGESAENLRFMEIIDKQFLEMPWNGSRQMARYMKRQGHKCGRHRVRRLMRLMRLVPIYQEPNTSKKHPQHKIWPYLLRNMVIDRPNQVWCADITYIPMRRGFLYLVAIMDWFSRKVLAWRLSNSMDADFCVEALKEAMDRYGARDHEHRPRQPVYRLRMDEHADGRQGQDQHGWPIATQNEPTRPMAANSQPGSRRYRSKTSNPISRSRA